MCKSIKDFTLCSCVDEPVTHNKKRDKRKKNKETTTEKEYYWYILRYIKTNDTREMGRVIMPSFRLDNGLTEDFVLEKINSQNCFDFDYTPQEKDCLHIYQGKNMGEYMAFTFKNGEWIIGMDYDAFNDELEQIGKGKIKPSYK